MIVISFIFLSVDSLLIENYLYTIPPKLGISSKNHRITLSMYEKETPYISITPFYKNGRDDSLLI